MNTVRIQFAIRICPLLPYSKCIQISDFCENGNVCYQTSDRRTFLYQKILTTLFPQYRFTCMEFISNSQDYRRFNLIGFTGSSSKKVLVIHPGIDQIDNALRFRKYGKENTVPVENISPKILIDALVNLRSDRKTEENLSKLSLVFQNIESDSLGT